MLYLGDQYMVLFFRQSQNSWDRSKRSRNGNSRGEHPHSLPLVIHWQNFLLPYPCDRKYCWSRGLSFKGRNASTRDTVIQELEVKTVT